MGTNWDEIIKKFWPLISLFYAHKEKINHKDTNDTKKVEWTTEWR